MRKLNRLFAFGVIIILMALIFAVVQAAGVRAAPAAAPPPQVTIKAADFSFDAPDQIEAGLVAITFENVGRANHNLFFFRMKDGKTFDDFKTALPKGFGGILEVSDVSGGAILALPGQRMQIVLDLVEGQYALGSSGITPPDPVPDVAKGMVKPLKVVPSTKPRADEPKADVSVTVKDKEAIALPSNLKRGPQTWQITNGGTTPHHVGILKPFAGKTVKDIEEWLKSKRTDPLTFEAAGGIQLLAPGKRGWFSVDLKPGEYLAIDDFPGPTAAPSVPFTIAPTTLPTTGGAESNYTWLLALAGVALLGIGWALRQQRAR